MRALIRRHARGFAPRAADPAPSRLAYRMQRLALTPSVRRGFTLGAPIFAVAMILTATFADPDRRAAVVAWVGEAKSQILRREEFMVRAVAVDGASAGLARTIRAQLPFELPLSSFEIDLDAVRDKLAKLEAVARVDLRVRSGGVLQIDVTERVPVLVWRTAEGLALLDGEGHRAGGIEARTLRPDLPLVAGRGADARVAEALALYAAARPLQGAIRGLLREGERRWTLVLDGGQKILLPETDPVPALERVIATDEAEDLMARDVVLVDMRNARRMTVRLAEDSARDLRKIKLLELGDD
ncbi:FtsQ-type POTRA domain-containing protein [Palleronia sediminis]|uniref:Cell division protein FtsQ n=1 Tax=Palleronia sediminis TaxID=2547833 RepID=A0A4R6AKH7_9RHOB|nr:cell division protein FtsQ/DivIB [Palleronia sediminis]TDL81983.1 FtsQ-type POTRA domain-containing protein [Palleronia sediminis]